MEPEKNQPEAAPQAAEPINPPVTPQPQVATPQPTAPVPSAVTPQKSSPWPWIVGGCLIIVILVIGAFIALGWWGARAIKKEIQQNDTLESVKKNIDSMSKESEEWQKKAEEARNQIPDLDEIQPDAPSNYPAGNKKK